MNIFSDITTFHFGETIYHVGGRFEPIAQPQLEFIIIHSGTLEVTIDDRHHHLTEGFAALALSRYRLKYTYDKSVETHVTWCEAVIRNAPVKLLDYLGRQPETLPVSRRMLELQRMGIDLSHTVDNGANALTDALGRALYEEYLYQSHRREKERPIHHSVLRARQFIEQNFSDPCSLTEIATYANVTPQYLIKLFRRDLAQTPIQYLWTLRAKMANRLLRRTGLSVAEIADRCGYENANHFSRHIREQFGITPTKLRRSA